jgi:predicted dinucleotide-binding enzyme/uncharacterized OsmC-like protein
MKIGIFGDGNVGSALARGLKRAGHEVRTVGNDSAGIRDTATSAELVVVAVPFGAIDDVVKAAGEFLAGKTVVDATNALDANMNLTVGFTTSGAEELQKKLPKSRVVKAFNTVFAQHMESGNFGDQRLTAFVAGDDETARKQVIELARGIGFATGEESIMSDQTAKPRLEAETREVVVRGSARDFAQEITVAGHRLLADEPKVFGGTDTGPSPYDLLVSALGACTSMTVSLYARRKQWPLDAVTVRLRHSKIHAVDCAECDTKSGMLDGIERDVELHGDLTEEQRARLLEMANRCPVHKTLTSEISIRTRLV